MWISSHGMCHAYQRGKKDKMKGGMSIEETRKKIEWMTCP